MTFELLAALALFAFVSSITPGPNNLMLMASGANFGFQRTIPHMLGVAWGFAFMLILIGLGLMQVFEVYPLSQQLLKVFCVVYLIYLALKISRAAGPDENSQNNATPFTFFQAALFQWVNPKAWTMALTAVSVYSPSRSTEAILAMAAVFAVVNLPSVSCWAILGLQMKRWLTSHFRLRMFNMTMAALLLGSLFPVLMF